MNLSTIAIALLAWQLLSNNNDKQNGKPNASPLDNISQFVSEDTKSIIDCVGKLSDKNCSQEDKTGALFQMMTNPTVMNVASSLFKKTEEHKDEPFVNDEGYQFETPSEQSRDFFKPIDNIADAEVKHKLYWFYDNWYVKR